MKKRIISMILSVVMVLGMFPTETLADTASHGQHEGWIEVTSALTEFEAGKKYYVPQDVTFGELSGLTTIIPVKGEGTVTICLYGETLDLGKNCMEVKTGTKLELCTCYNGAVENIITSRQGGGTLSVYGTLEAKDVTIKTTAPSAAAVTRRSGATITLDGCFIDGTGYGITDIGGSGTVNIGMGTSVKASAGPGIYIKDGGTLNMNGKEIIGTTAGIEIAGSGATVNLYKGEVSGNIGIINNGKLNLSNHSEGAPKITGSDGIDVKTGGIIDAKDYVGTEVIEITTDATHGTKLIENVTEATKDKFVLKNRTGCKLVLIDGSLYISDGSPIIEGDPTGHTDHDGWTAASGNEHKFNSSHYIYLQDNVTLIENVEVTQDTTLCLNGKTLDTGWQYITVNQGVKFRLCDCSAGKTGVLKNDKISYPVFNYGTLEIYSGTLEAGENGSGGTLANHKTAYIYGGTVKGIRAIENNSDLYIFGNAKIEGVDYGVYNRTDLRGVELEGAPQISGGLADFYLQRYSSINAEKYSGEIISIEAAADAKAGDPVVNGVDAANKDKFTVVNEGFTLEQSGIDLVLKEAPVVTHSHSVCGKTSCTDHKGTEEFSKFTHIDDFLGSAGSFYLEEDTALGRSVAINQSVTLCLNGHTLDLGENNLSVYDSGNLTVCDCKGGGVIKSSNENATIIGSKDAVTIYGGTIIGTNQAISGSATFSDEVSWLGSTSDTATEGEKLNENKLSEYKKIWAEDPHSHSVCGKTSCTGHDTEEFSKFTHIADFAGSAGSFYLEEDTALGRSVAINQPVTLCLNGHTLDLGENNLSFYDSGSLTVCDCKGGGVIKSSNENATIIGSKDAVTVYGGTIIGTNKAISGSATFSDEVSWLGATTTDAAAGVALDEDKLDTYKKIWVGTPSHIHPTCGDESCTEHSEVTFTELSLKTDSVNFLGTSGHYYLTEDMTSNHLYVNNGAQVTICLNGYKLDFVGQGINVTVGASLVICDCSEQETGTVTNDGSCDLISVLNGSSLTLESGNLVMPAPQEGYNSRPVIETQGNQNNGAASTFTMNGGTITSAASTWVISSGYNSVVTINAGSVTSTAASVFDVATERNSSYLEPGVKSYLIINGEPTISSAASAEYDVHIGENIGYVTVGNNGYSGSALKIYAPKHTEGDVAVQNVNGESEKLFSLVSDVYTLKRGTDDNANNLVVAYAHEHSWTYTAENNVITAKCEGENDCTYNGTDFTLTLNKPAKDTYGDGRSEEATITETSVAGQENLPEIKYYSGNTELSAAPTDAGSYTAKITVDTAAAEVSYEIKKADPEVTWPENLTATAGTKLSEIDLGTGFAWAEGDTLVAYGDNKYTVTYTPADTANYNTLTAEVNVTGTDRISPMAQISIGRNRWQSFLGTSATFELFYKDAQTVKIEAEDEETGVKSTEYYVSDRALSMDEVKALTAWNEYTAAFSIEPNGKFVIYAKVTDNAGNVTIISSDGIVLYTDSEADTESVAYTLTSKEDKAVSVKLNGNTVASLTLGETALTLNTDYTVNNGVITIKGTYLDTLTVGEHSFTVTYKVLGEFDLDHAMTTEFKVTVEKAAVSADMFTFTAPSDLVYDGNAKEATLTVNDGITGMGSIAVKYYDEAGDEVEEPTNAGTYTVKISAAEGASYKAATELTDPAWTFTVEQREVELTWTAPENLEFDGYAKAPTVTAANIVAGDSVRVNFKLTEGHNNINAGKFTCYAFELTDSNYKLPESIVSPEYEITPRALLVTDFEAIANEVYTGTAIEPEVVSANTLVTENDYTVTSYVNNVNAGTATVTVTGKNNAKGSIELSFIIEKAVPETDFENMSYEIGTVTDGRATILFDIELPSGYTWNDPETEVAYGTFTYEATFTPEDTDNYQIVSGVITVLGKDMTAPTGTLTVGENTWNSILNDITFGIFFNETQKVTVTANDTESGVLKTEYYLANAAVTDFAGVAWTEFTESFNIDPNNEYVVYVKITDRAGNAAIINSDGIVLDNILPVISGLEEGRTYYKTVTATVTDKHFDRVEVNGEVIEVVNGEFTITANDGALAVKAYDKAGNVSAEITVYVEANHSFVWEDWVMGDEICTREASCICGAHIDITVPADSAEEKNLEEEAEFHASSLELIVEKDSENIDGDSVKAIENAVNGNVNIRFAEVKVKFADSEEYLAETEYVIAVPVNTGNVATMFLKEVYREINGEVEILERLSEKPTGDFKDGTYYVDEKGGIIYIYSDKAAVYGFVSPKSETEDDRVDNVIIDGRGDRDEDEQNPNTGADISVLAAMAIFAAAAYVLGKKR